MPATDQHRAAVRALPGVLALDLGIPVQAFGNDPRYQATVCADPAAGPVRSGGFTVIADAGLEALVAPPRRDGGQAQFVAKCLPPANGDDLAAVRGWMLAHLDRRQTRVDWARELLETTGVPSSGSASSLASAARPRSARPSTATSARPLRSTAPCSPTIPPPLRSPSGPREKRRVRACR